jgi:iron complex transport system permease protein
VTAARPGEHTVTRLAQQPARRTAIPPERRRRGPILLVALAVGLVLASLLAAGRGQVDVPPDEVLGSLLHHLGLDWLPGPRAPQGDNALWLVRFPRVALAIVVGASLGTAGAVMQGVFGNPLAEPAVVGVSSGAAVGAFAVIVLGWTAFGGWTMALAAFVGGLLTTLLVYVLSRADGRTEVVTLVLTGIAVNAATGAVIGLLTFATDDDARTAIAFWTLGSLNRATWGAVLIVLPLAVVGLVVAFATAGSLDLLSLGERSARHLGVDVERLRLLLIATAALLTAAATAFSGIIAFVGLVVPHLVRMVAGPHHRFLVPASALGGALVLVLADLVARTAVANQELPLGVLTALVGGPFFFWLLRRTRARSGGWA